LQNPLKRVFEPYPDKAVVVELAEKPLGAARKGIASNANSKTGSNFFIAFILPSRFQDTRW
jgi:hypothetical protein